MAKRKNRRLQTLVFDRASVREIDENGFLHVAESPLTIVQVAPYYGYEIPHYKELGLDVRKTYYGYRPAEELSKPETIKSVNGIPIQYGHHEEYPDRPKNRSRVGMTGTDGEFNNPYLVNSLHIIDRTAQDAIKSGEARELSLAYAYEPDFTGGFTEDGEKYDFIMRNITANHVALVEKGRAGPSVLVKDSSIRETPKMEGNEKLATIEEKLTEEVVPALQDALKEIQTVVSNESEAETAPSAEEVPASDDTEATEPIVTETEVTTAPAPTETVEQSTETAVEATDADKVEPEVTEQATETETVAPPVVEQKASEGGESVEVTTATGEQSEAKDDGEIPAPDPRMIQALLESGFSEKPEPLQRAFADGFAWAIKSIDGGVKVEEKIEPPVSEDACNKSRDEAPEINVEIQPENETEAPTAPAPSEPQVLEEKQETVTLASDEAQRIREGVIAEVKAIDECKPVLGNVRLGAFDSANGVYLEALKQLGIGNIGGADARACYLSYVAGMRAVKQSQKQVIAQDARPKAGLSDFLKNVKD